MNRMYCAEAKEHVQQPVLLQGWVHTVRVQSKVIFLLLRDRTGIIQCVITREQAEAFSLAKKLPAESVVTVTGTVVAAPPAPGGYEVQVAVIVVLAAADPELPIPVVGKGGEETDQAVRLDYRWIDLRKPEKLLIFKVWTLLEQAFREYFLQQKFLQIHSPKLMSAPSEGGAELFTVQYFERKAYLAQSPQFYKQMAMAAGFERVFEVGPVFRAEPSFTTRHATEFTGFDFEMSFVESHEDVMAMWENAISFMLERLQTEYGAAIADAYGATVVVPALPFPRYTMAEAKKILAEQGVKSDRPHDFNPEEEKALGEFVQRQRGHEFVFVTDYSVAVRPFYHMRSAEQEDVTKSFDLLWKGVEITTGAQREHRYDILRQQALEKGVGLDSIAHYLNFFRYGCPPHGGAGIGPGRMVMQLLNAESIREVTYLYRGVKRLVP